MLHAQQSGIQLDQGLCVDLEDLHLLLGKLQEECHEQIAEVFRCLLIGQHVRQARLAGGAVKLHPKLNDIICPTLNQLKLQSNELSQRVVARVLVHDVLPCLDAQGKVKSRDAVIDKALQGLALEGIEEGNRGSEGPPQQSLEVRGCEMVLREWLLMGSARRSVFEVYGSDRLKAYLKKDAKGREQHYVNVVGRIVGGLLLPEDAKSEESPLQHQDGKE